LDIGHLNLKRLRGRLIFLESTASTNDVAKELAEEGCIEGAAVVADEQTAGRGRQGRSWISPKGAGLYLSVVLRPTIPLEMAPLVTLLSAVATAETIREEVVVRVDPTRDAQVDIKWPNDILLNDSKVCGILTETGIEGRSIKYIITGIGVNLNHEQFPDYLAQSATSIFIETGCRVERDRFCLRLLSHLDRWYDIFLTQGGAPVLSRWRDLSTYGEGKRVSVSFGNHQIIGLTRGLTPEGALLIEGADGNIEKLLAGEITSLRQSV